MALKLEVLLAENQRTGEKGRVIEINYALSKVLPRTNIFGREYSSIVVRTDKGKLEEWPSDDGIILY